MNAMEPPVQEMPLRASPHAHDKSSVDRIMLKVCLALTPATAFGVYQFGWPALILFVTTILAALASEFLCLQWAQRPLRQGFDGSALLTGWLFAACLPPWAPWWIGVGGAAFAIMVGKHLYGGIGQNLFNPAMLARVALLISFPVQMTTWVNPMPLGSELAPSFAESFNIIFGGVDLNQYMSAQVPDGITGATWLGASKAAVGAGTDLQVLLANEFNPMDAFLGLTRGSMGETSALLLLLGGLYLIATRVISWHIPVSFLASLGLLSLVSSTVAPESYAGPMFHLLSGGTMMCAFFIATEYVTAPTSNVGKLIFGAGIGLVMFAIRCWGGFPEAVAFAVLFMNALAPLIDRSIKPRAYGRTQGGAPLEHTDMRKVIRG